MEITDSVHHNVGAREVQNAHSRMMICKEEKETCDKRQRPPSPKLSRQLSPKTESSSRTGTSPSEKKKSDHLVSITRKGSV